MAVNVWVVHTAKPQASALGVAIALRRSAASSSVMAGRHRPAEVSGFFVGDGGNGFIGSSPAQYGDSLAHSVLGLTT